MEDNQIQNNVSPKWYAVRVFTSSETKVKETIEMEAKRLGFDEKIVEIVIPHETVFEVRNGKRRQKIKNFLPGYILINCMLDKRLQEDVSTINGVVNFIGRGSDPTPLQQNEIDRIVGRVEERKDIATMETKFSIGDPIKVIDGPFAEFNGTVKYVNNEKQKLKVEVGILGRKTPVELDFTQVELENH
ncbi:transcription termination/antitermination protein NusG [Candidatus Kapabacteria bacterium]|nr:transcription termination/antitermination protein NusG [Candidatus Kapabacteria bacterium]